MPSSSSQSGGEAHAWCRPTAGRGARSASWGVQEGAASLARRGREKVTKKVALERPFTVGCDASSLGSRRDRPCLIADGYVLPEQLVVLILASGRHCRPHLSSLSCLSQNTQEEDTTYSYVIQLV